MLSPIIDRHQKKNVTKRVNDTVRNDFVMGIFYDGYISHDDGFIATVHAMLFQE